MAQLMPLPLTVSCFSKIQIGFTFLVPAHPGSLGKRTVKLVCVCVCVCDAAGPAKWGEYAAHALGPRQSPIVIRAADAIYDQRLQENALQLHYTEMDGCSLSNSGRSVQLNVPAAKCCMWRFYA